MLGKQTELKYQLFESGSYVLQQNINAHVHTGTLVAKHVSAVLQWLVHGMWISMHGAGSVVYVVSETKIVI